MAKCLFALGDCPNLNPDITLQPTEAQTGNVLPACPQSESTTYDLIDQGSFNVRSSCGLGNALSSLGEHLLGDSSCRRNATSIFDVGVSILSRSRCADQPDHGNARSAIHMGSVALQRLSRWLHVAGWKRLGLLGGARSLFGHRNARCLTEPIVLSLA